MKVWMLTLALCLTPAMGFAERSGEAEGPAESVPASSSQEPSRPQPRGDRFEEFLDASLLTLTPYVYAFAGGVLDQIGGFPEEWAGAEGFEKRNAARVGGGFASDAIGHAAAAVLHHRVAYDVCACKGVLPRTAHGMLRAFVSVTDDGGRAPNWSLWFAKYASAGLANAWYPDSYTKGDVLWQATSGIVITGGLNVLKEFSPELMRLVHLK